MTIHNLNFWEEEFGVINKEILEKGATRETARRLLIFTEGFMYKIATMKELTEEEIIICKRIRQRNKEMKEEYKDLENEK